MKRALLTLLVTVALAVGGAVLWFRTSGGAVVRLDDAEVEAARASGEASREIVVEAAGEVELPALGVIKDEWRRERFEAWAAEAHRALEAAGPSERGDLLVLTAEIERVRGNVAEAVALAREGAEAMPSNGRARYVYGSALLSEMASEAKGAGIGALLGNLGKAREFAAEIDTALELDPSNHDARVKKIVLAAYAPFPFGSKSRAKELVEGIEEYRGAFDRDFWRGQLLVAKEDLDGALEAFRALEDQKPGDPDVVATIGELQLRTGDLRGAVETFDSLIDAGEHARHVQALYEAAKARERAGVELEHALELLDRYLEIGPVGELQAGEDRVQYHRGVVLAELGRFDEALEAFAAAARAKPGVERVERARAETLERAAAGAKR